MTTTVEQARPASNGAPPDIVALPQHLAAVRAALAPHLDRPGAARLLLLAVDLLLAGGGPCPWSLTDLTHRLGCARKSALLTLRLGEELGLLHRSPGPRVGDRRGPAPTAWTLRVTAGVEIGLTPQPVVPSPGATGGETGGVAPPAAGAGTLAGVSSGILAPSAVPQTGVMRQSVSPGSGSEITSDSETLIRDLIQHAVAQTREQQPARMIRRLGPVLADLVDAGWTATELRALIEDASAATVAYQPVYPAAYLAQVIAQRLTTGRCSTPPLTPARPVCGQARPPVDDDAVPEADLPPAPSAPPRTTALIGASGGGEQGRPRRLPRSAASVTLPLPPAALWRVVVEDVLARQPREAQYLAATAGVGCVGDEFVVQVPSAWVGDRLTGRLRRAVEAALQARVGQPLTLVYVVPVVDEPVAVALAV